MIEKTAFIFDICSSTKMIDFLYQNRESYHFNKLIGKFNRFLDIKRNKYEFENYKFLGDGYLLIFEGDVQIDRVLFFSIELSCYSEGLLKSFIEKYLSNAVLPRIGITMGIDKGFINDLSIGTHGIREYTGRAINVACRLQSTLKEEEHVYKLLMLSDLYPSLKYYLLKKACVLRQRSLRYLFHDKPINCYEFDPLFFRNFDFKHIKKPTQKMKRIIDQNLDEAIMFRRLNDELSNELRSIEV